MRFFRLHPFGNECFSKTFPGNYNIVCCKVLMFPKTGFRLFPHSIICAEESRLIVSDKLRLKICLPAENVPEPDCTEPTGWHLIRCWKRWFMHIGFFVSSRMKQCHQFLSLLY